MTLSLQAKRALTSWLSFVALLGVSLPALADSPLSSAERLERHDAIERANALWRQQRYEQALELYNQAYAVQPHPDLLYRIAQANEKLGRTSMAASLYDDYLDEAPENPYAERIREHAETLRGAEDASIGTLLVRTRPAGATLLIDNRPTTAEGAVTPVITSVSVGEHTISVSLQGYISQQHTISVSPGEHLDREYALEPLVEPEQELQAEPEPEPKLQAEDLFADAPPERAEDEVLTYASISTPPLWRAVGYTVLFPSTIVLAVGLAGLAIEGLFWINLWGPVILGGAAGVGASSYVLFIKKWKPRIEQRPIKATPQAAFNLTPARALGATEAPGFQGLRLKVHF